MSNVREVKFGRTWYELKIDNGKKEIRLWPMMLPIDSYILNNIIKSEFPHTSSDDLVFDTLGMGGIKISKKTLG